MTLAPLRQSKSFRGVAEVIDALREAGHRVSAPARHVLEALFAAEGPLSAERIAAGVEETSTMLEITSVYRNLERLEQLGVVSHVHLGHGPGLYALARDGDREYLVCDRCGRVTSLKPEALEPIRKTLLQAYGHHARFSHFAIHGHCEPCMRALASNAEQPGTGRAVDPRRTGSVRTSTATATTSTRTRTGTEKAPNTATTIGSAAVVGSGNGSLRQGRHGSVKRPR